MRAAEGSPGVGRGLPRCRVAGAGQAAAFGVPAGARGRNRGHVGMVGERGAAGPLHPRNQLARGGHGGRASWTRRGGPGPARPGRRKRACPRPAATRTGSSSPLIWYLASTSRTSARPSAGRPAHTATSAVSCAISPALSMLLIWPTTDLDLPQPRGGGLDVAAQQVDLGAQPVHRVVIAVAAGSSVSGSISSCRLGRAASGEHRLGRVARGDVGIDLVVPPALAGRLHAAQPCLGGLGRTGRS